jgi:hypothetical protein
MISQNLKMQPGTIFNFNGFRSPLSLKGPRGEYVFSATFINTHFQVGGWRARSDPNRFSGFSLAFPN